MYKKLISKIKLQNGDILNYHLLAIKRGYTIGISLTHGNAHFSDTCGHTFYRRSSALRMLNKLIKAHVYPMHLRQITDDLLSN